MEEKITQSEAIALMLDTIDSVQWEGEEETRAILIKDRTQGPAWVKASRQRPKHDGLVHLEIDGLARIGNFYDDGAKKKLYVQGPEPYILYEDKFDGVLWLDKSGSKEGISDDAHEKEIMMQAFDRVRQIFESRNWIMEGRGSYPYNDDRYKEEVRYLFDEFEAIRKDTWANVKTKSFEYRKRIIEQYVKEQGDKERDVQDGKKLSAHYYEIEHREKVTAIMFSNWLSENAYMRFKGDQYINITTKKLRTASELYDECVGDIDKRKPDEQPIERKDNK